MKAEESRDLINRRIPITKANNEIDVAYFDAKLHKNYVAQQKLKFITGGRRPRQSTGLQCFMAQHIRLLILIRHKLYQPLKNNLKKHYSCFKKTIKQMNNFGCLSAILILILWTILFQLYIYMKRI